MSYQDELQARLDAVRTVTSTQKGRRFNTNDLEEQLVQELQGEFELSQYDLDEGDILRSIKIMQVLQEYQEVFSRKHALRVFYALAKSDVIQAKSLYRLSLLDTQSFKQLLASMLKHGLITMNDEKELEITMLGKSLAERIGVNIYI